MVIEAPLACRQHDHKQCIGTALDAARHHCKQQGVRLTELREQVLLLIWDSHKPLGAYALIEMLSRESTRRIAPPTVYRALDFLLEQQLIHRIHSLNAFIGCTFPGAKHPGNFMICRDCGVAVEFDNHRFAGVIDQTASEAGFMIDGQSIELVGLCEQCQGVGHG